MPRWLWITLVVAVLALFWAARDGSAPVPATGPGGQLACPQMPAPERLGTPLQANVGDAPVYDIQGHRLRPLAGFALEARVLRREDYRFDRESSLSPTDLALGWGPMADPQVYQRLDISQRGRWYYYRWGAEGPPIPLQEIIRSSANMHLVPADATVAAAIRRVQADQTVRLRGWLVEVEDANGWRWRSSLSREDSGSGACELIYVCEIASY
ncbi:hypothetical protein [Arenimonas caeni]|jgi:hypothetical protein|uniref:Uncharacterized protein n=1 Tax=Arenimonas caeni TaxID=2058085 RepID=A0A2P6M698_9GAMM|nr:hypothetical protein [Arenimonas caeni]MDY0021102.1 hypothetical protein [Arenimonas caeni]PRH81534.1 hypothetical protein C6N40_12015 [Arenimonas caeni]